jgi:hypothetical protein
MGEPLPPSSSPVDTVLEAARAALEKRRAVAEEHAARIRSAIDAYLAASEGEIAAEFASKIGIPFAAPDSAHDRALALAEAVGRLPELLNGAGEAPQAAAATASVQAGPAEIPLARAPAEAPRPSGVEALRAAAEAPRAAAEAPRPAAEPSRPAAEAPRAPAADPARAPETRHDERALDHAVATLLDTVKGMNFASMPIGLFRAWAEELAAEARMLQDRGADKEATGYVIRMLTRCAYDKGVRDVRGLNHRDVADWAQLAERAHARRLLLQGGGPRPLTQRMDIPEAVRKQVAQTQPAEPPAEAPAADDDEEESTPPVAELPLLRASSERGPVVLIGGIVKGEKIDLIRQRFGLDVEWVDTSRMGTGTVATLEKRVRENRLAALVLLDGLLGHKHFEPLIAAARQVGLPHAYGGRAGAGSLLRAFRELEGALGRQAAANAQPPM